jgi:glycerophosphoryl diester phosphodiesterase
MVSAPSKQNQHATSRKPLVIAHRGASAFAPENTMAAFKLALLLGADGIELDVQLSSDGYPVVIHDRRLDRTTGVAGRVSKFSANDLGQLDAGSWFARRLSLRPRIRALSEKLAVAAGTQLDFSSESVPRLDDVLKLVGKRHSVRLYIELKTEPGRREQLLETTISAVRDHRMQTSITLLSFDHQIMARAKQLAPEIRSAATFAIGGRTLAGPRKVSEAARLLGVDEVALHFGLANRRMVSALRDAGLSISVWTVNNRLVMRKLITAGVGSIMTNYPDRLFAAMERHTLTSGPSDL